MIFGVAGRLLRVQCKTVHYRGEVMVINLSSNWHSPSGYVRRTYSADEIDFVAAHDPVSRMNVLLPISLVDGMRAISLRLTDPMNAQRAGLHYAADYEFRGAVAQLGEHYRGTVGVVGSSPISSTAEIESKVTLVGAHEFRNRFGWYMERAAAGETIRVSRHGTTRVQLMPVADQLDLAA